MAVIKSLHHLPDPLGGVKGQIFKFRNNSVVNISTEISHADSDTKYMEDITHNFRSKAWVRSPGWTKGACGINRLNTSFLEHGHVAYQINGNHDTATWWQRLCHQTLGEGSNPTFSDHDHVTY